MESLLRRRNLELVLLLIVAIASAAVAWSAAEHRMPELLEARRAWMSWFVLLIGAFLAAHLVLRLTRFEGTQVVLPVLLMLAGVSAILLFAFRDPLRERMLYPSYIAGVVLGCGALVITARFVRLAALEHFKYVTMMSALLLAGLLVVFGTGPSGTGTRINLFGFFQPIEAIKLLVVLFLAAYLAGRDVELRRLDGLRLAGFSVPRWRDAMPVALLVAATLVLLFLQRDLGPALLIYLTFLGLLVVASQRVALGLAGFAVVVVAFWGSCRFGVAPTVCTRIDMWMSPWDNARPGGVQLAESLWALASGGVWGSGFGRADSHYIPAGHTDLILSAVGESAGLVGVLAVLGAVVGLCGIAIHNARTARTPYLSYLGVGMALLVGIQTALIAGGTVGLLPLTGVPFPFLGYGKSATIVHFALAGLVLNLTAQRQPVALARSRWSAVALVVPIAVIAVIAAAGLKAARVMALEADAVVARGALTPQADGVRRFNYNRRLLDVASAFPRGSILDRNGLPLAVTDAGRRSYPAGDAAAQLIGQTGPLWSGPLTVERAADHELRGYDYHEDVVMDGRQRVLRRDYAALVPAFRQRFSGGDAWSHVSSASRDVRVTLDVRLQRAAMSALERNLPVVAGKRRRKAAAVVLDAASGQILAAVSLPSFTPGALDESKLKAVYAADGAIVDRARTGSYVPGSVFKIVTAAAALEAGLPWTGDEGTFVCHHVDRIGWDAGRRHHLRRITDDVLSSAHREIDLPRAVAQSCNVYFAWLATRVGAKRLFTTARERFGLRLDHIPTSDVFAGALADHAYGQGRVTVSPLEMAAVAATVANGGMRVYPTLDLTPGPQPRTLRALEDSTAAVLQQWLVDAVENGTGTRAAVQGLRVGGKTGTAQTRTGDGASHAWFAGFAAAPGDGRSPIAFAFLIENGGYGGRAAAQAAHDFLAEWDSGAGGNEGE